MLAGCTPSSPAIDLPPVGAAPDYQLGGAYDPDPRVEIIARDRTEHPAEGAYSICCLNGFQTQPGERDLWSDDQVLRDPDTGDDVIDPDWPDEVLLDTRTDAGREAIADRVGEWIRGCADAGFDAVEFDNLDSYTRSNGLLTFDDNLGLARMLVDAAHAVGLAAAQKNAAEDAARLHADAGFDFAVVEECAAYDECGSYTDVYGDRVIDIEYTDELPRPFTDVCADESVPASVVLRDRGLVTPDAAEYVFELCP
ncbi:MAG: endo alpha-1,4 polygalactosaminidase [Microbacterium sp.]|uniref:endo alpha-1,4 polygalactosaminidase n=1 Tax=Microbacterium sp. TaxID=51671 RepID=UPI0026344E62|nr:endo alpha-1,4 polygalactosaminidase [Microbacterium sp.]MCX6501583.1 endo alpha-1,4 polygalactosaminidase [Microbacterium sp.]